MPRINHNKGVNTHRTVLVSQNWELSAGSIVGFFLVILWRRITHTSLSPPFEYIEWRCMCYVKVIIQNLQQSKKLQWQTRSSDSELPETKLMNYYLRRLWISSLTSVIMLWSTVGLESLRIRLSEYNSSGFAFLNKPWIIKSTLSDCRLLHEVPLLLCSLDVPWI